MNRQTIWKIVFVGVVMMVIGILPAHSLYAATAKEIDVSVDVALERFYKEVKGAQEFMNAAKGVLVLPKVIKGGFVVGGEYGEGALRIGGKTVGYYNIASASFGLTIGGEQKDIIVIFMQEEALKKFRASKNWEAGVDGNIALINLGAGATVDTKTIKDPIVGFVFGVKGLIADASFKGSKLTKLEK